jgi:hypothetical protein
VDSLLSWFSTSEFFRAKRPFAFVGITLLRQQDVAKWMPTKEKGRFARKNSLVENCLYTYSEGLKPGNFKYHNNLSVKCPLK